MQKKEKKFLRGTTSMSLTAGSGCVRVKKIKFPPFYSSHFHSYSTQLPSLIFFGGDSLSLTATVRLLSCYTTKRIFYLFRFEFFHEIDPSGTLGFLQTQHTNTPKMVA